MNTARLLCVMRFSAATVSLICQLFLLPTVADAQSQGQNGVYNSVTAVVGSSAFTDASMFATTPPPPNRNLCGVLNYILDPTHQLLPASGGVIDARGLPATGTSMTCTGTPWSGITNPPPSTILLPAGTIVIPATWTLPTGTHLIGVGESLGSGTTIQATTAFASTAGPMIAFCSSACMGVSVERLSLDGLGGSIKAIMNQFAGEASFVDHVGLYQIRGTGLLVQGSANNSGPYSNITFDTGGYAGTTGTVCAQILNVVNGSVSGETRGIRGLYCRSETNDAPAAVLLDSSNNFLKDVTIVGFYDGIRVGSQGNAQSNVLMNIIGDTGPSGGATPVVTVHIPTSTNTVTDLSLMGIHNSGGANTFSIRDELTATYLSDLYVGVYALGKSPASGVYSRFTTSPSQSAVTWAVGQGAPTGNCGRGSLYSCTGTLSNCGGQFALWACALSSSNQLGWQGVK
jgi:hypothetical protein